jgi:NAD-dependent DNA ligase
VLEASKTDLKKGTEKKAPTEGKKARKTKLKLTLKKPKKTSTSTKTSSETHIHSFVKTGIDYLHGLSEKELISMLETANDAYYNESSLMSDGEYDILKEYIEDKYPKNKVVKEVGAPIVKEKVKLPYYMGSMDKIKPDTGVITRWIKKYSGPYVLSAKLDGISGLYSTEGGVAKLYTRGNGVEGQDISYMIPYLQLPKDENITIRGELIMSKKMFETKYASTAANARNLVSGFSNRKTVDPDDIRSIDFVAYEVIHPTLKPSEQFALLTSLDVKTVIHDVVPSVSNESLSELLVNWRDAYEYEIDGVICTNDAVYPRKKENPKYAFAFKMVLSDQVVEAKVVDVLWAPSKDGYLKPRVRIEPVVIGGARIEYATAFNGAFVEENKIGVGAVVRMIRSGDVIPYIMAVVTPASTTKMPDVPYVWNESHIDVMLEDASKDPVVLQKNITGFFTGIGVVGLSSGNVKRLMDAGFDSVHKILSANMSDFLKADGFKEKLASKVHTSIHNQLEKVPLAKLMSATNLFGRGMGERRIQSVLDSFPNILIMNVSNAEKEKLVASIDGFARKTAKAFVEHIDEFLAFAKENNLMERVEAKSKSKGVEDKKDTSHPLYGKSVLLTGFRDKALEQRIKDVGGKIATSVSKKTDYVVVIDMDETTGKADKARKLGVTMILVDDFNKLLGKV